MLIDKLLAPRWKHKNPQVRKRALLALDPQRDESQRIFAEVLSNDPELHLRRLAIRRLNNINLLQELRDSSNQTEIYQEATHRLCELLAISNNQRPVSFLKNALENINEARINEYVALHANDEGLQLFAMEKVTSESVLAEILTATHFENNKKHALARLNTANSLKRAIKILKRRDKDLANQAQEMLDRLQEKSRQFMEQQKEFKRTANEILELINLCNFSGEWSKYQHRLYELNDRCKHLQKLVESHFSSGESAIAREVDDGFKHFEEKLKQAEHLDAEKVNWEIKPGDEEQKVRPPALDHLNNICIDQQKAIEESLPENMAELVAIEKNCQQLSERLENEWASEVTDLEANNLSIEAQKELQEYKQRFTNGQNQIKEQLEKIRQSRILVDEIESLNAEARTTLESSEFFNYDAVERLLEKYNQKNSLDNLIIPVDTGKQLDELMTTLQQKREELESSLQGMSEEFTGLIDKLELALNAGKARAVTQLVNRGRNILKQLPDKFLVPLKKKQLLKKYNQLARQAESLLEWQQWSAATVKEQLIEEVQKLAEETNAAANSNDFDFAAAAEQIGEARRSWRKTSKGVKEEDENLWKKFDDACNRAYQPCQNFFDEQGKQRLENLRQREKICQDLEEYFHSVSSQAFEEINWKALTKILKVARDDWGKLGTVDRKDRSVINKRFYAVLDRLDDLNNKRKDQNSEAKQQLVSRAETCLKQLQENKIELEAAISSIKVAQKEWKNLGPGRKDQTLWKNFRSACNAVFGIKQGEQEKFRQQVEDLIRQREEIISGITECSEKQGDELLQVRARVEEYQDQWRAMDRLKKGHKLERRFIEACDQYARRLRQVQREKLRNIKQQLDKNVNICYQLEKQIADVLQNEKATNELADSLLSFDKQWISDTEKRLKFAVAIDTRFKELKKIVDQILAGKTDMVRSQVAAQQENRLLNKEELCINMEILADKESPAPSKQKRMEIQVARLADSMKRSSGRDIEGELEQLISQWHTSGFVLSPERQDYEQRFYSALELLDKDYQYPL